MRKIHQYNQLRGFNFFFFAGMIGSLIWVKGTYYDPKYVAPKKVESDKELDRLDAEADKILFKNRLEAYSRPHRSLEDLIAFLSGQQLLMIVVQRHLINLLISSVMERQ
ncbi:hypothetical protein FGO68_gene14662 [Halteria grandinella]|uniref:Uncharacterized protein n=1 Tax=Halteria grandinella TaxID=5974 RepID=A0A8J8NH67_HALGN|nr:hypothetical protein FGO68_gene14662 [Halteria grandinella]